MKDEFIYVAKKTGHSKTKTILIKSVRKISNEQEEKIELEPKEED